MGFAHHFSSDLAPAGKRALYAEVSYSRAKPFPKGDRVQRIIRDLKRVGILSQKDPIVAQDINDIEYGYPIYDQQYSVARKKAVGFLTENSVLPCGRYGSWRYMSMEDAILDGKRAAELI